MRKADKSGMKLEHVTGIPLTRAGARRMWRKKTTFAAVEVFIDYGYSISTDIFTVDLKEGAAGISCGRRRAMQP